MPLRCMTVAPLDRKLCVLTRLVWTPTSSSLSNRTLFLRALVMVWAETACSSPFGVTKELMMWFWKSRDKRALSNLRRIAMIGHVITAGWSFGNLWCVIGEPLTPVFWFARHSVTAVHCWQRSVYEEKMLNLLVPSHNWTSFQRNGMVWRWFDLGAIVYSQLRSKKKKAMMHESAIASMRLSCVAKAFLRRNCGTSSGTATRRWTRGSSCW